MGHRKSPGLPPQVVQYGLSGLLTCYRSNPLFMFFCFYTNSVMMVIMIDSSVVITGVVHAILNPTVPLHITDKKL